MWKILYLSLSRGRRVVENSFGLMCARFRVLLDTIYTNDENADVIVKACTVLHNFLIYENPRATEKLVDTGDAENGLWRGLIQKELTQARMRPQKSNRPSNKAIEVRDNLKNYFNGVGAVSWQKNII